MLPGGHRRFKRPPVVRRTRTCVTGSLVSRSGRDWVIPFPGSPLIRGTLLGNCFALNDLWLFERRHHLRQHLRPDRAHLRFCRGIHMKRFSLLAAILIVMTAIAALAAPLPLPRTRRHSRALWRTHVMSTLPPMTATNSTRTCFPRIARRSARRKKPFRIGAN